MMPPYMSVKVRQTLWDGAYGLSSLSEKTRNSNRLQMLLERQHFLLSLYLKTLSVGPAGVWTYGLPLSKTGAYPIELTGGGCITA